MVSKNMLVSLMIELQNQNTNARKRYEDILCCESPKLHVNCKTSKSHLNSNDKYNVGILGDMQKKFYRYPYR